jgi:hypothetical protein
MAWFSRTILERRSECSILVQRFDGIGVESGPLPDHLSFVNQRKAVGVIRAMRGGAQAKLILADDGHRYVVKFTNNPQHRRTLINEAIGTALLGAMGLPAPVFAPIEFDAAFLRQERVEIMCRSSRLPVPAGLHFGSRFPSFGSSRSPVVYDHLPSTVLRAIDKTAVFVGAYVADQWMSNTDRRQAIFYRDAVKNWRVELIDHGQAFGGKDWRFANSFGWGTFTDPVVYEGVKSFEELEVWADRIRSIPEKTIENWYHQVPEEWIQEDEAALRQLLSQLHGRRRILTGILERAVTHEMSFFRHIRRHISIVRSL